jgi:hypothetical protein
MVPKHDFTGAEAYIAHADRLIEKHRGLIGWSRNPQNVATAAHAWSTSSLHFVPTSRTGTAGCSGTRPITRKRSAISSNCVLANGSMFAALQPRQAGTSERRPLLSGEMTTEVA